MALTATQRAQVRTVLGWSAQYSQTDNKLENAFDGLATEPEHEALVIAALADVDLIEAQMVDARKRLKAVKVGSIGLDTYRSEMMALRDEGRRVVGKIAVIMGVEVRHDIFSPHGPQRVGYNGPVGGLDPNFF